MVSRTHAMRFVGQHVVFRTNNGVTHHGILNSVTDDGIHIRPIDGRGTRLMNGTVVENVDADLLQNMTQKTDDVNEAFWPFFFFPFLALAFLWPWAWWW